MREQHGSRRDRQRAQMCRSSRHRELGRSLVQPDGPCSERHFRPHLFWHGKPISNRQYLRSQVHPLIPRSQPFSTSLIPLGLLSPTGASPAISSPQQGYVVPTPQCHQFLPLTHTHPHTLPISPPQPLV